MIIENFNPFYGKHCETTVVGNLLQHCGLMLSEPMLFGIGEGLSFIYCLCYQSKCRTISEPAYPEHIF